MSLASEVTTWQEPDTLSLENGVQALRFRTLVRTNVGIARFRGRLSHLGLLALVEHIEHYETNWHWSGTGQGYEIVWRLETTFADLLPLARL